MVKTLYVMNPAVFLVVKHTYLVSSPAQASSDGVNYGAAGGACASAHRIKVRTV